jgi:hypothetical protein
MDWAMDSFQVVRRRSNGTKNNDQFHESKQAQLMRSRQLAAEFSSRNVEFFQPLKDDDDVCGDSKSRTPTAICCSSGVLVHDATLLRFPAEHCKGHSDCTFPALGGTVQMKKQTATKTGAAAVFAAFVVTFGQLPPAQAAQNSQTSKQPEMQVTVVGCVQSEAEYRKAHDIGRGGALGTGAGSADEFVLINATRSPAGSMAKDCASATGGDAYELTGKGEDAVKPFVGHWVEISGKLKEAKVTTGTSGTDQPRPTGGFDPMNRDLKLFELDVDSIHDYAPAAAITPAPVDQTAANTPATPAPAVTTPAPGEPQATGTSGRDTLPSTGSELPLVGLLGAFCVAAAIAIRSFRTLTGRIRL